MRDKFVVTGVTKDQHTGTPMKAGSEEQAGEAAALLLRAGAAHVYIDNLTVLAKEE